MSMFHRVRVFYNRYERISKYKPISAKDTNQIVNSIYDYIQVRKQLKEDIKNKELLNKKFNLESEIILLGKKHNLIDFANGQGRDKKKYTIEVIREVLHYHLNSYFIPLLKLLTYVVSNEYNHKVKDKDKLSTIVKKYGISQYDINNTERFGFIL